MMDIKTLTTARGHPNVHAFLAVIRAGEGTAGDKGYRMMFGGELFDSFSDHPRRAITRKLGGRPITSTAAGAYQFLSRTWDGLVRQYGFSDFTPRSQDLGAVALIAGRSALRDVLTGDFESAVRKCNREWASLPESPYGQPTLTWARARAVWDAARVAAEVPGIEPAKIDVPRETISEEKTMPLPALVLALLPQLISSLPSLAKIVSRSEGESVTERNVKLAEKVGEIVTEATGESTIEGAVKAIQSDPGVAQRADAMIAASFAELMDLLKFDEESRGRAREFGERMLAAESPTAKMWRALGFGCLMFALSGAVVGGGGWILYEVLRDGNTPPEQKGMIIGAVIAAVTQVLSYFFGSSASSRAKDTALMERQK